MKRFLRAAIAMIAFIVAAPAFAQPAPPRTEMMTFKPGVTTRTIRGSIRGYDTVDYRVRVRPGQRLNITLKSSLRSNYFNLIPQGKGAAIYNSSMNGNTYRGVLPRGGDYAIRIYLMRNEARRNKIAHYTLTVSVMP